MKFTLETASAVHVRSVAGGSFTIGDKVHAGTVALSAAGLLESWPDVACADLNLATLAPLLELAPELIIIGTGSRQLLPDRDLMFAMARSGVGLEVMDTAAAARTFNVLINEGRAVAAVLYPTDP